MENNYLSTQTTETVMAGLANSAYGKIENYLISTYIDNSFDYGTTSTLIGKRPMIEYDEDGNYSVIGYIDDKAFLNIDMSTLPQNVKIKKAEIVLYQDYSDITDTNQKIGIYNFNESETDCILLDFAKMKIEPTNGVTSYVFDVTSHIAGVVYNEATNCKFFIKQINPTVDEINYIQVCGYYNGESVGDSGEAYVPKLRVTYESNYSVNSSNDSICTHNIDRFGQGMIDFPFGNLMFETEDFVWGGNRMPITIKHLYNSVFNNAQYTMGTVNTADYDSMKMGCGWKLNVMQSMRYVYFYNNDKNPVLGYVFFNENGEEICFKESELTAVDENSQTYNLYESMKNNEVIYDPVKLTLKQDGETLLFDSSGRLIKITDNNGNDIIITYTDNRLTSVADCIGRVFTFAYNASNYLSSITAPDGTSISYTYNGGYLKTITYPDGTIAQINYSSYKPASITLKDANGTDLYKVAYTFNGNQVASVTEYGYKDGIAEQGASSSYEYYEYKAVMTTSIPADSAEDETEDKVITTTYSFDNNGNIIGEYIHDPESGNVGVGNSSGGINPYACENSINLQVYNNNFLTNHSFSVGSFSGSWTKTMEETEECYTGIYNHLNNTVYGKTRLRVHSRVKNRTEEGVYQTTPVLPAGAYTLSAYGLCNLAFEGDGNIGGYLRIVDSTNTVLAESEHLTEKSDTYTRLSATFTLEEAQAVTVQLFANGKGAVYFNAPQLENNMTATAYNMLENGSFENTSGWTLADNMVITDADHFEIGNSLKITGNIDGESKASQKVYVTTDRTTRETFTFSGWAKGQALQDYSREGIDTTPLFRLRAVIHYNDTAYGETEPETFTADFVPDNRNWQFASVQFSKSSYRTVDYIEIFCDYDYNANEVYFDNIQLTRDSIETGLTAEDFALVDDEPEIEDTTTETDTETESAVGFSELTDDFGNILTETTFTDGEFGTVYRSFEYDEDGNNLTVETDARGNRTVYTVDPVTSRNTAITDRCGNKTAYEYDAMGRTTKVTSKKTDDSEIANVAYAYDCFDNMTEIVRGDGLKYALGYDAFHKLESIGINSKSENLVKYIYKTGNGRLKQVNYANGDYMHLTYNGLGQIIAEKWYDKDENLTAHYKYTYDGDGNIIRSIDILGLLEYNYTYEDGALQCATDYTIEITDEIVTSKTLLNTIQYYYDTEGALLKKQVIFADGTEQVTDYENPENGNVITKLSVKGKTVTSHSKNDSFGRTEFEELQLGAGVVSRQFDYLAGKATDKHIENEMLKSTPTTQLVSKITMSDGRTLSYEYDEEERITKVIDSAEGVTEYTYDELGQLLTETVNGETVNQMTYDNYGNILTKDGKEYKYDTVWKDLLTSVGKETITYDEQGNPLTYLGHNLTWEKGRQLKSFDNIQYTYNANGIRTSKTVDGIRHDFVIDGVKILKESYGSHTIETLYDNADSVCGIIYNGTPYYFLKNLQGDIISITDNTGTVVANYTYDAWGKVLSISGDNIHIGAINPYRYRGYYYDSEINMYYLQSRYYDPEVGRFVNGDSAEYSMIDENLFTYCANDPICNVDDSGFWYYNTNDFYKKNLAKKMSKKKRIKITAQFNKYISQYRYNDQKLRNFNNFIYRQENEPFASLKFGNARITDVGCELIAIYNAMKYINKFECFQNVICECYMNGLAWNSGKWGMNQNSLAKYFDAHDVPYKKTSNFNTWIKRLKEKHIGIMTFGKIRIHTVAVVYKNEKFLVMNAGANIGTGKGAIALATKDELKEKIMWGVFKLGYTF